MHGDDDLGGFSLLRAAIATVAFFVVLLVAIPADVVLELAIL